VLTAASPGGLFGLVVEASVPLTDDAGGGFPAAPCDIFGVAGLHEWAIDDTFGSSDDFAIKMGEAE
jgi:hypothetical protein